MNKPGRIITIVSALLAVLLIACMPSYDSVWTDEGQTWHYAKQPSLQAWQQDLVSDKESEALMPLGMMAPMLGAKVLGTSEWSMRALNILWALLALVPISLLAEEFDLPWLPLFFAVQPFLWFYANEARPYVLQIAEGAWLLLALVKYLEDDTRRRAWAWCFVLAGLLLCCTSLLGVIPFGAMVLIGGVVLFKRKQRLSLSAWLPLALAVPVFMALGAYYLWALHRGAESSKVWTVSVGNLAFSMYELLGFSGLGPGRVALRGAARAQGGGVGSNLRSYLPGLTAMLIAYGAVAVGYLRGLRIPGRAAWILISSAVVVVSTIGLAFLAVVAHFPFWGRHLAPVLPSVVLVVALCIHSVSTKPVARAAFACVLGALLFTSSMQLRFSARHKKDDYRTADQLATKELSEGKRVWWFADVWASRYYGQDVTIVDPNASGIFIRPDGYAGKYQELPPPAFIVLSKPDIYDNTGSVRAFIRDAGYHEVGQAQAFEFFEK